MTVIHSQNKHHKKNDLIQSNPLKFSLLTKSDISVSLIISACCLVISIGVIGTKNLFILMLFLKIHLMILT